MIEAIRRASAGTAPHYGEDDISIGLKERFSMLFERDVEVLPVITGTAANALALSTIVPPYGAIFCLASSHIVVDECGAAEFFTHGARLLPLAGSDGKVMPAEFARALSRNDGDSIHQPKPAALSLAQSTEAGTVYTPDELRELSAIARARGLKVHMDGARFANALAHLGCSPADASWKAGVDVLSFGATKGGAIAAEAVIMFDPGLARDLAYRRKKAGHLVSKMRFMSAQLEAYIEGERWLRMAEHANTLARKLAGAVAEIEGAEIACPVETNMVMARLPDATVAKLRSAGARFYDWEPSREGKTLVRLVTSFATEDGDIAAFTRAARA